MGHWERQGECPPERCQGRCCEQIGVWFDDTPDSRAYVRAMRLRGLEVHQVGSKYLLSVPQRCQYLTDQGLCALHPDMNPEPSLPERPSFCDEFPVEPSQTLLNSCGYTFAWVEDAVGAH